jgi:hypothetical protein
MVSRQSVVVQSGCRVIYIGGADVRPRWTSVSRIRWFSSYAGQREPTCRVSGGTSSDMPE